MTIDNITQENGNSPINWLITGATGFIGKEVLTRILCESSDKLCLLVRQSKTKSAQKRIDELLSNLRLEEFAHRIAVIQADLGSDSTESIYQVLTQKLQLATVSPIRILHLAANTNFNQSPESAKKQNVKATKTILELAQRLFDIDRLDVFSYVSTAYVLGHRSGLASATELDLDAEFRNTYEQSKAEAEQLIRQQSEQIPTVIFRPSIVVGDSKTGKVGSADTMYWALKMYLRGLRVFFANRNAQLDLVPVDYVADAMLYILNKPDVSRQGQCYPLVAGSKYTIDLDSLSKAFSEFFDKPKPIIIPSKLFQLLKPVLKKLAKNRKQLFVIEKMQAYLPYFSHNPIFDDLPTSQALHGSGICQLPVGEYLPTLLEFCKQAGWHQKNTQPVLEPSHGKIKKIDRAYI